MGLRIEWRRNAAGGRYHYLRYRYKKGGKTHYTYVGPLYVSPTPILDTILENLDRLDVEVLIKLRNTPKYWRPIKK